MSNDYDLPTVSIEVESQGNQLRVRLLEAPDQQGRSAPIYAASPAVQSFSGAAELGQALFASLFGQGATNEIGRRFTACYSRLRPLRPAPAPCMRLLLECSAAAGRPDPAVGMPWELLHDGQQWLVYDGGLSLARLTTTGRPRRRPIEYAFRILLAYAEPRQLKPFDGERIVNELKAVLDGVPLLYVELLPRATRQTLGERIQKGNFDIVHFLGHGEAEPDQSTGVSAYLHLESNEYPELRLSEKVPAQTFADWLAGADAPPQLLVLTTCQSGVSDLFGVLGIAQAALHGGVPAAIGMQSAVLIEDARRLSQALYRHFATITTVDDALHAGRLALANPDGDIAYPGAEPVTRRMLNSNFAQFPAWAVPILLLNGSGWLGKDPPRPRISWRVSETTTVEMVYVPEGGFYVDVYPVAQADYGRYVAQHGLVWDRPSWPQADDKALDALPATNVSIDDAQGYATWTGRRLPTVAQWQLAALAGSADKQARFPWGSEVRSFANTRESGLLQPLPVADEAARYAQNRSPAGMCGIIGNVAEYVFDSAGVTKVCGGSFIDQVSTLAIQRALIAPSRPTRQIGFRCVATLADVDQARRSGKLAGQADDPTGGR